MRRLLPLRRERYEGKREIIDHNCGEGVDEGRGKPSWFVLDEDLPRRSSTPMHYANFSLVRLRELLRFSFSSLARRAVVVFARLNRRDWLQQFRKQKPYTHFSRWHVLWDPSFSVFLSRTKIRLLPRSLLHLFPSFILFLFDFFFHTIQEYLSLFLYIYMYIYLYISLSLFVQRERRKNENK